MLINPKNTDLVIYPANKTQVSAIQLIAQYVGIAVGTAVMTLGTAFKCGIFLAIIINSFYAITTYWSLRLMSEVCITTKCHSPTEAFAIHISSSLAFPFSVLNTIGLFMCMVLYIQFIQAALIDLFAAFGITDKVYLDPYLIALYVLVLSFPGFGFQNAKFITLISFLKNTFIFFLQLVVIFQFAYSCITQGFDPNHERKYFNMDSNAITAIFSFGTAYLIQPVAAPGISSLKEGTKFSILLVFKLVILFTWMMYNIFGLLEYLTFFDENESGFVFHYYQNTWIRKVGNILLILMMISSVVLVLNPIKYSLIKAIAPEISKINSITWISFSIILYVAGMIITKGNQTLNLIISVMSNIFTQISLYIIPSVLYLILCSKQRHYFLIFAALFNILIAILIIGLVIYYYFFA